MNGSLKNSFDRFVASIYSIELTTKSCGVKRTYNGQQAIGLLRDEVGCALAEGMERTGLLTDAVRAELRGDAPAEANFDMAREALEQAAFFGTNVHLSTSLPFNAKAVSDSVERTLENAWAAIDELRRAAVPAVLAEARERPEAGLLYGDVTSKARDDLATFFREFLKRNDYRRYIAEDLAGDFAYSLMGGIDRLRTALDHRNDEVGKLQARVRVLEANENARARHLERRLADGSPYKSPDVILYEQLTDGPPHPGFYRNMPCATIEVPPGVTLSPDPKLGEHKHKEAEE